MVLVVAMAKTDRVPHLPVGRQLLGLDDLERLVGQRKPLLPCQLSQVIPRCPRAPAFMKLIKNLVEMVVVYRSMKAFARAVLQQVGKLMATGVGQQVESGQLTTEIPPLQDFPAGEPAHGAFSLLLGHNHANTVSDLMLPGVGIVTVVGGLAGADPA